MEVACAMRWVCLMRRRGLREGGVCLGLCERDALSRMWCFLAAMGGLADCVVDNAVGVMYCSA